MLVKDPGHRRARRLRLPPYKNGGAEAKLVAVTRRGEHRQEIWRIVGRAGGDGPDGRQETQ